MNRIALATFLLFSVFYSVYYFCVFSFQFSEESPFFLLFANTYSLLALFGSSIGLLASKFWGGKSSRVGKAILFTSVGLLFQFFGQLSYAFYLFILKIEYPYPSFAEIFFFGSIPLYILGTFYFAKTTIVGSVKKSMGIKAYALLVTIMLFVLGYANFYYNHDPEQSSILLLLLEIFYPLGQSIYIGIALISIYTLRNVFGGKLFMNLVFIFIGLIFQYIADTFFLWIPISVSDGLYLASYTFVGLGLILFYYINFAAERRLD